MIRRTLPLLAAAAGVAAYLVLKERRRPLARGPGAEDRAVEQRIRETLAQVVAEPGAIQVTVHDGMASLRGPVLPGEGDRALTAVLDVPGVLLVKNFLEPVEPVASFPT